MEEFLRLEAARAGLAVVVFAEVKRDAEPEQVIRRVPRLKRNEVFSRLLPRRL